MVARIIWIFVGLAVIGGGAYVAFNPPAFLQMAQAPTPPDNEPPAVELIVAQGRLGPLGGVFNIPAPPGQRIESILVSEGDQVVADQTVLAKMANQTLLELQVQLAAAQRADASLEIENQILAAEIQLRAAEAARATAALQYEQLHSRADETISERQIEVGKEKLERMRKLADDPQTQILISEQEIADQALALEKAEWDLSQSMKALRQSIDTAELAVKNADQNIEAARQSLEIAQKMRDGTQSLELAQSIAQAQLDQSRLIAPISGTVLKIMVKPGEAAVNMPLMQIGDLSRLECVAEVNDRFIRRVRPGQRATIRSPALPQPLNGTVRRVGTMVGNSSLPHPSPLAMVDTKTVDVFIDIDVDDAAAAASFVNLQVTVEIQPDGSASDDSSSDGETTNPPST